MYENYFAKLSVPNDDKVKWNQLQLLFSFHNLSLELLHNHLWSLSCRQTDLQNKNKSPFFNLEDIFSTWPYFYINSLCYLVTNDLAKHCNFIAFCYGYTFLKCFEMFPKFIPCRTPLISTLSLVLGWWIPRSMMSSRIVNTCRIKYWKKGT